ncbi:pseudaminic acid cytidylyltransferase [Fluviicola sp.]|jgi:N-acylneuraminate cytidylyltransferase|uniref:pseudaminic acid cytidylyltransferase n=1 Tax=Fluviicola sp. TaxID=1917219 RepID=UPI0028378C02|nr:pseudaminic acid cytidylyltransferase [Fluviicola sp.]MDR0801814.1 pseudaminic acid cytidylyltransferase [Fluviicola sp.]
MIAIIPARGGSKRIPGKNIRPFLGKPIIAYTIENALKSGLFNEVIVSTDDQEIAETAIQYGASVPFTRSEKNSDDYATTADVLAEVLEEYTRIGHVLPATFCCLYPTSPLIHPEDLVNASKQLKITRADVLVSAVIYSFPIQRSFRLDESGLVRLLEPESMLKRSQDLKATFHDAGAFYFFNTEKFLLQKTVWSDNTAAYLLDELKVQDIDNETDWKLAELKFQLLNK